MTSTYAIVLLLVGMAAVGAFALGRWAAARPPARAELPREWSVMARPVLNSDERRALRVLREAMPQYTILAKLPLVRLCQARDPQQVRFWYDLLAPLHISFAVCSANGRVLAVVDLEPHRGVSRRATTIKQSVMEACRIRYLLCKAENLPSASELQLLLPQQGNVARPVPLSQGPKFQQARSTLSDTVRSRRAERSANWGDSGFGQDSFFAPESRFSDSRFPDSRFEAPASEFGDIGEPQPRVERSAGR